MVGGITTPSSNAQTELLKKLLNKTETHPNQIGFVEAHGTGTQLGDRAEITAIANSIGIHRTNNIPLKIGSIKGHIGHLEAAAGIIGLLKMIVMMRYEIFLPQANLNNPIIKKDERNIEIQRQVQKWESCADIPRIGIINCFGFGGTNFAMIVSQYRNNKQNHVTNLTAASSCYFLPIAAKSEKVLAKEIDIHIKYLSKNCTSCDDNSTLRNLCYTNAHRRFHHSVRIAVVGRSAAELIKNLKIAKFNIISSLNIQPEIVFVFPGMGCHYANMGIQLMNCSSIFGKILKEFNDEFCKLTNNKIRLIDGLQRDPIDSSLSAYAIPSIEIALSIFLEQIGILPSVVVLEKSQLHSLVG
jgi:acyl transferase domain-containing protein